MSKVSATIRDPTKIQAIIGDKNGLSGNIGNVKGTGGTKDYNKLNNLPSINGVPVMGDHDSAYYGIDITYTYNQQSPSAKWTIQHNLGKHPSVTVVDSAGTVVVGDVQYIDDNIIEVSFSGAFIGTAYLN